MGPLLDTGSLFVTIYDHAYFPYILFYVYNITDLLSELLFIVLKFTQLVLHGGF